VSIRSISPVLLLVPALLLPASALAQGARAGTDALWAQDPPPLPSLVAFGASESELRRAVPAYSTGRTAMLRETGALPAEQQGAVREAWYRSWLAELAALDFDTLGLEAKVDYILLRNRIELDMTEGVLPPGNQGPIGAEALARYLERVMIPYTADELIAIAEREFAWMDDAMIDASRRMGYGDDWRAAVEAVKDRAVPPGEKPGLIRDLAYESEAFLEAHNSITIPPLMQEIWRMGMRGPQGQLTNPFFTGGLQITISYPTDDMTHDFKLMSMRGNNPHFNRATVHHELIPGHGLQSFMTSRFNPHRSLFSTSFWGEGWALYYEFVLWDQGFPRGPEDEIGMLTWRKHRAARIIFSLRYHLGEMTPEEAVEFLVDRVAFERSNSEAEVLRSIRHSDPLYQLAYMIGGLQFYALRREFVDSGILTEREFHDTILQGGRMPIEGVRLRLTGEGLTPDYTTRWRFEGDPLGFDPRPPGSEGMRGIRRDFGDGDRALLAGAGIEAAPSLAEVLAATAEESELRVASRRYRQDLQVLRQRYDIPLSPVRIAREREMHEGWRAELDALASAGLSPAGREEHAELREAVAEALRALDADEARAASIAPHLPFARPLQRLQEDRRARLDLDPMQAAQTLEDARKEVLRLIEAPHSGGDAELRVDAAEYLGQLRNTLSSWYGYHFGFDPMFTWWVRVPYAELEEALERYEAVLRGG
jgi:hypothetical protein